jgi:hypothetical protein
VSFLAVGACTIDANQAGDNDYSAAPSNSQSFSIGPRPTVTALSFLSPLSFGEEAAAAFVSSLSSSGGPTPLGTVAVTAGQETLCSATVTEDGQATCRPRAGTLSPGHYEVLAAFSPSNTSFGSSESSTESLLVTRANTEVAPGPSSFAQKKARWRFTMSARLTSSRLGLPSQRLHFSFKSLRTFTCSATTSHEGVASCSISGTGSFKALGISKYTVAFLTTTDYSGNARTIAIHLSK